MGRITQAPTGIERLLRRRTAVGRDSSCDITLDHDGVSRKHAELSWNATSQRWEVEDQSRNGTLLNGRFLARGEPHRLRQGDRLQFGPEGVEWIVRDVRPQAPFVTRDGEHDYPITGIVGFPIGAKPDRGRSGVWEPRGGI